MCSHFVQSMFTKVSSSVYSIYTIVRKPRLVLDFTLTLILCHIILTTYYSAALPSSLFFWIIMSAGAAITTVLGEQMCVKREMREGISIPPNHEQISQEEEIELGSLRPD